MLESTNTPAREPDQPDPRQTRFPAHANSDPSPADTTEDQVTQAIEPLLSTLRAPSAGDQNLVSTEASETGSAAVPIDGGPPIYAKKWRDRHNLIAEVLEDLPPAGKQLEAAQVYDEPLMTALSSELGLTDLPQRFKTWRGAFRRYSLSKSKRRIARAFREAEKHYAAELKKLFPKTSGRQLQKLTQQCVTTGLLLALKQDQPAAADGPTPALDAVDRSVRAERKWAFRVRALVYPILAAIAIPGIGFKLAELGVLPDPVHYMTRDQDDVLADAAAELRVDGYSLQADMVENLDIEATQRGIFTTLGLTLEDAEKHMRRDQLNHMGEFGLLSKSLSFNPDNAFSGEMVASYERRFDTLLYNPNFVQEEFLRHELTHRVGYFQETSWGEKAGFWHGAGCELDEGLAYYVQGGLPKALDQGCVINMALLATLVGMPEGGIQSEADAEAAFTSGLPVIGRAYLINHNFNHMRQTLDQRFGAGTFHRVVNEPFQKTSGHAWMTAALLAEIERGGSDMAALLKSFEARISPNGVAFQNFHSMTAIINGRLGEHDAALSSDRTEQRTLGLAISDAYTSYSFSEMFRWAAAIKGSDDGRMELAKQIYDRQSGSVYWAQAAYYYAKYGYAAEALSYDEASAIIAEARSLQPQAVEISSQNFGQLIKLTDQP